MLFLIKFERNFYVVSLKSVRKHDKRNHGCRDAVEISTDDCTLCIEGPLAPRQYRKILAPAQCSLVVRMLFEVKETNGLI